MTSEPDRFFAASNPTSEQRLDLAYLPNDGGKMRGYDITVTHPVPANLTFKQAEVPGRAAEAANKRKDAKYNALCEANDIIFQAAAYEVGGRPSKSWSEELHRLFLIHDDGGHKGFQQYWKMRISVALQTGIANAILVRNAVLMDVCRKKDLGGYIQDDIDVMLNSTYVNNGAIVHHRKIS